MAFSFATFQALGVAEGAEPDSTILWQTGKELNTLQREEGSRNNDTLDGMEVRKVQETIAQQAEKLQLPERLS